MGFILSALLYLIIAILVLCILVEYNHYQKFAYYTRQGLRYTWKSKIVGFLFKEKNPKNDFEIAKELTEVAQGDDLALTYANGTIQICPLTPKALKEFFEKEEQHTTRHIKLIDNSSDLRKDGEIPHRARAISEPEPSSRSSTPARTLASSSRW